MVVEKTRLCRESHETVAVLAHGRSWLEKLGLFHMGPVHLVKFPPVAICVQESHVLNGRVDITHVL